VPAQWDSLVVPAPHLLLASAESSRPKVRIQLDDIALHPPPAKATIDGTDFQNTSLSASLDAQNDAQFRRFMLRHPGYGFERVPKEPDDPVNHAFNAVFKPEPIHLGKRAVFSCTIWTAIKRKNPLCLLNPIVINASW